MTMNWTKDKVSTLEKMWKSGKSAAEIAKALGSGVTRNAVIGKAHRLGLSGRPTAPKKKVPAAKTEAPAKTVKAASTAKTAAKPSAKAAPATGKGASAIMSAVKKTGKTTATPVRSAVAKVANDGEVTPPHRFKEEPSPVAVSLLELTDKMCRWPIGDPKDDDFHFCGRASRAGTPYCDHHASVAFQGSGRNRATLNEAIADDDEEEEDTDDEDDDIVEDDEE